MKTFNSVASLKLAKIKAGGRVARYYYERGGSGYAEGVVKTAAQAAADGDIIDEFYNVTLANDNVWVGDNKTNANLFQFGAAKDRDNLLNIQAAINHAIAKKLPTFIPPETFTYAGQLNITTKTNNFTMYGVGEESVLKRTDIDGHMLFVDLGGADFHNGMTFKNFRMINNPAGTAERHCLRLYDTVNLTVENIRVEECRGDGIYLRNVRDAFVEDITCVNTYRQGVAATVGERISINKVRGQGSMINLVDIEPNVGDALKDIYVGDVRMINGDRAAVRVLTPDAGIVMEDIQLENIHTNVLNVGGVSGLQINNISVTGSETYNSFDLGFCANVVASNIVALASTVGKSKLKISNCNDVDISGLVINSVVDNGVVVDVLDCEDVSIKGKVKNATSIAARIRNSDDVDLSDFTVNNAPTAIALLPTTKNTGIVLSNTKMKSVDTALLLSGDNGAVTVRGGDWRGATTNSNEAAGTVLAIDNVLGMAGVYWGDSLPTTGSYVRGDKWYKKNPTAGGKLGWSCIQSGDYAGTAPLWREFGDIST